MHEPKLSALRYPLFKHALPGKRVINVVFLDADFQTCSWKLMGAATENGCDHIILRPRFACIALHTLRPDFLLQNLGNYAI